MNTNHAIRLLASLIVGAAATAAINTVTGRRSAAILLPAVLVLAHQAFDERLALTIGRGLS